MMMTIQIAPSYRLRLVRPLLLLRKDPFFFCTGTAGEERIFGGNRRPLLNLLSRARISPRFSWKVLTGN